ncbi:MAG: recombinase family protein [Gaiellaceae bacterium]
MTLPLIAYVRVSRVGDREESGRFHSPKEQEDRARGHAASKGWTVGEVVTDLDVSGGTHPNERPGMSYALDRIRAGEAGGLVSYSLDRLSRDPSHGDWLVREVTSHGGVVAAPDMPEDITTPTGEFTFGMLLGVARLYRRTAGARFQSARERATRSGVKVARTIPLGYTRDADRRMVLDPETAPIVAELFERRIAGASDTALARFLTERTGRQWARQAVPYMLANPIYHVGRITDGEFVSEFEAGAIVDSATFAAAQRPKHIHDERTAKGRWLLTGLVRCEACGRRLSPWKPSAKERAKGTRGRYRCNGDGCRRVSVHREVLETMVVEAAFAEAQTLVERPAATVDLTALEQDLVIAERRLEQMLAPESQDALGDAWAATAKARREERDAAAAALGEARALSGVPGLGGTVLNLGWIWDDLAPDQQRLALQEVYAEVRVAKGNGERVPVALKDGTTVTSETPALTFIPREPHPWRLIEMAPAEIEQRP